MCISLCKYIIVCVYHCMCISLYVISLYVVIIVCVGTGGDGAQWQGLSPDQHIAAWILQHYASLSFRRALTHADMAALERRARAGSNSPAISSHSWDEFQDWFCKTIKALKQVCLRAWDLTAVSEAILQAMSSQDVHGNRQHTRCPRASISNTF